MTIAGVLLTLAAAPDPSGYLATQLADRASQWWQSPDVARQDYAVKWRVPPAGTARAAELPRQTWADELEQSLYANPYAEEDRALAGNAEMRMAAEDNLDLV